MMQRSTLELFENKLRPVGVSFTPPGNWLDVMDYCENYGEGDVLVVARRNGSGRDGFRDSYHPTTYYCARLLPVANTKTSSFDNPLYKFPRVKRAEFKGEYRVEEIYLEFEPRRHSGMYRELIWMMKRLAAGKVVNWKVSLLDGIPIRVEDRKCRCCVG